VKGTVYTGIIYFPQHPQADMHGQLRCVVRTSGITNLTSILRSYGIPFSPVLFNYSIWTESVSVAEQTATEREYGRALVCATWAQYLSPEHYEPIADKLRVGATQAPQTGWGLGRPVLGPHLFEAWDGETGVRRACQRCPFQKNDEIHVKAEVPA
jgi:hypothetical protein